MCLSLAHAAFPVKQVWLVGSHSHPQFGSSHRWALLIFSKIESYQLQNTPVIFLEEMIIIDSIFFYSDHKYLILMEHEGNKLQKVASFTCTSRLASPTTINSVLGKRVCYSDLPQHFFIYFMFLFSSIKLDPQNQFYNHVYGAVSGSQILWVGCSIHSSFSKLLPTLQTGVHHQNEGKESQKQIG